MTLREKYKKLQDKRFVKGMIIKSTLQTMELEGQTVTIENLEKLYEVVQKERALKAF